MSERLCFDAADFGELPQDGTFCDETIQKAIDKCFLEGGGEVRIPSGTYRIRSVRLRSRVTLHLMENCVIEGSRDVNDYFILKNDTLEPVDGSELSEGPWIRNKDMGAFTDFDKLGSRWHNGMIRAYKAENVAIIGEKGSTLNGKNCYDEFGEEHYRGPHGISMICCKGVTLKGYTVINSGNWANHVMRCENVLAEDIECRAGHDGIHMTLCENVVIRNCRFYTGDDCVAGFANRNLLVEDCEINTACSAFRLGGTNVLIQRCNIFAPAKYSFRGGMTLEEKISGADAPQLPGHRFNMLSVYTYYSDFSVKIPWQPGNVVIRDCAVDGADRFLHFNFSGNERWQKNRPLADIKFINVDAKNISMPLTAYGAADVPLELEMNNVKVTFREGKEDTVFMRAANFKKITLDNVSLPNCRADTLIRYWGEPGETVLHGLETLIPEKDLVKKAEEDFVCKAI